MAVSDETRLTGAETDGADIAGCEVDFLAGTWVACGVTTPGMVDVDDLRVVFTPVAVVGVDGFRAVFATTGLVGVDSFRAVLATPGVDSLRTDWFLAMGAGFPRLLTESRRLGVPTFGVLALEDAFGLAPTIAPFCNWPVTPGVFDGIDTEDLRLCTVGIACSRDWGGTFSALDFTAAAFATGVGGPPTDIRLGVNGATEALPPPLTPGTLCANWLSKPATSCSRVVVISDGQTGAVAAPLALAGAVTDFGN